MAGFIDNETKKQRQEYIEERERRRKAVVDAEVSAFLESIDDIYQDVAKEVELRYVYDGKPPSLVNIICDQATTAVADSQECAEKLLRALQQREECVSSIAFRPFEPTIYNDRGESRIIIYFSWR